MNYPPPPPSSDSPPPPGEQPPPGFEADKGTFARGFVQKLLDYRFTTYITPSVVSVLYVLGMVAIAVVTAILILSVLASGFSEGAGYGLLALIIGVPLLLLLGLIYLIFLRIILEFYSALVRLTSEFSEWRREWRSLQGR